MNKPGRQLAIRRTELLKADQTREVISIYILFPSKGDLEGKKEFFFVLIHSFFLVLLFSFFFLSFFLLFLLLLLLAGITKELHLSAVVQLETFTDKTDRPTTTTKKEDKNYNKTNKVTGTQAMSRRNK